MALHLHIAIQLVNARCPAPEADAMKPCVDERDGSAPSFREAPIARAAQTAWAAQTETSGTAARDCRRSMCLRRTARWHHPSRAALDHLVGRLSDSALFSRSTKTVRCSRASEETNGHRETSRLATNETGATAERNGISSHDVWFEIKSTGLSRTISPSILRRMPNSLQTCLWYQCGKAPRAAERRPAEHGLHRHERNREQEEKR